MNMELLTLKLADLIIGTLVFVMGMYISLKYVMPKVTSDTAVATADAFVKHPKMQPLVKKLEKYEKELEPIIEKVKEVDFQELIDMAKGLKVFIELQNKGAPPPPPPKRKRR